MRSSLIPLDDTAVRSMAMDHPHVIIQLPAMVVLEHATYVTNLLPVSTARVAILSRPKNGPHGNYSQRVQA